MLQIEAVNVGSPEEIEVRFSGVISQQPQLLRLAAHLPARQPSKLHQHQRTHARWVAASAAGTLVQAHLGVHPHLNANVRVVVFVLREMLVGKIGPRVRLL